MPSGALVMQPDSGQPASGNQCLRIEVRAPGHGGLIQRIAVTPRRAYKLSSRLRTSGFKGKAYACVFTRDLRRNQLGRTEPITESTGSWTRVDGIWRSGDRRVVYAACYVEGTRGTVWFDDVRLTEVP